MRFRDNFYLTEAIDLKGIIGLSDRLTILYGVEHFISMSLNPHFAPFFAQFAIVVDQERAAFDAHEFASIQGLFLDDVKLFAQFFFRIGQEVKREFLLGLKFLMGGHAVSRNAQNYRVLSLELRVKISKILPFGCTARGSIFWVKVDDDIIATKRLQLNSLIACRGTFEILNNAIECRCCHYQVS